MILLAWIFFCITDGISDAFFYNVKDPNKTNKPNEHIIFTVKRGVVFGIILFQASENFWSTALVLLLLQPFLHNNSYYNTRHALDKSVYEYSLLNQSKKSTAFLTRFLTPMVRVVLAWLGIMIFLLCSTPF